MILAYAMPSKNTAYFAMIPQIYKSISEKQNKKQKLYIKVINALGTPARFCLFL